MTLLSITMKQTNVPPRKTGRPLSFDPEHVLKKAMLAFWKSGYETTSISDLTAAMGVTAPSLYAVFGNKQQLFIEAMRLYVGDRAAWEQTLYDVPTAREAVAGMLRGAALLYTGDATPPGCLLASAAATGSPEATEVRAAVTAERFAVRDIIIHRIEEDIVRHHLSPDTPAIILANLALAVTQGMSVLARDGADRGILLAVADASMKSWAQYEV